MTNCEERIDMSESSYELVVQRYEALERHPINGSSWGFVAPIGLTEASIELTESSIAPREQRMVATC